MRARFAQGAAVAATIVALTGCKSSNPSGSTISWWGKNKNTSTLASAPAGPQLPSVAASSAPGMGASSAASHNGFAEQQATTYPATNYPATPGYAATPAAAYGAPASGNAPPAAASSPLAQNGPYSPAAYGQPAGSTPATNAVYGTPAASGTDPYAASGSAPLAYGAAGGASAYGAPAGQSNTAINGNVNNSYATGPSNPGSYPATNDAYGPQGVRTADASARNYPAAGGAYNTAPAHPNTGYITPPSETYHSEPPVGGATGGAYPPAGSYPPTGSFPPAASNSTPGSGGDPYATPAANTANNYAPASNNYQPGDTGYAPGQTGYAPQGVTPYQAPVTSPGSTAPPAGGDRRDPYYRPGSTSDFSPGRASRAVAGNPSDSYPARPAGVVPAAYDTPAGGNNSYSPAAAGNAVPATGSGY